MSEGSAEDAIPLMAALQRLSDVIATTERTVLAPGVKLSWPVARHSGLSARTVVALNVKAVRLAKAMLVLARARSTEAAGILLRAVFELGLLHQFIDGGADAIEPALRYHAHVAYQWVKMLRKNGDPNAPSAELAEITATYDRFASMLPTGVDARTHWFGPGGLERAAEVLGQGDLYQTLFRMTSRHVHHTDIGDSVKFTDEGIVEKAVPVAEQDDELRRIVDTAASMVAGIALVTAASSGIDTRELETLLQGGTA